MQLQIAWQMPLSWNYLTECLMYKATVSVPHKPDKHYYGLTKGSFKTCFNGHTHSFRTENRRRKTVKDNNQSYEINWSIAQRAAAYKCGTRRCDICLTEKTMIAAADPSSTLNKRAEIVSTCRYRAKFRYDRVSGAPTWWASRLGPMWEASGHMSLSWWWTIVTPTQLCWRYHGSSLGQWHIIYHPPPPSLVIHDHLTLTPQCTL